MSKFNTLALSALILATASSGGFAADTITVPTSTPAEMPVYDDAGFNWSGFYAGVYGGLQNSTIGGAQYGLGVDLGVNTTFDFVLLGGEVSVHGLAGGNGNTTYGQVLGRAGLIVTDNVAVYGAAGYGLDLGAPAEDDVLLGGGVEVAVTDAVSVKAQYLHAFPISGANPKDQFTVGANYHF